MSSNGSANGKWSSECCTQCGAPRDQETRQCSKCLEQKRKWYYKLHHPGMLELKIKS